MESRRADRKSGRSRHSGLEQRASNPTTAIGRLYEHHGDPPVAAVIDTNRAADNALFSCGGEASVGSQPKQHPPVVGRLIPTGAYTQPEAASRSSIPSRRMTGSLNGSIAFTLQEGAGRPRKLQTR